MELKQRTREVITTNIEVSRANVHGGSNRTFMELKLPCSFRMSSYALVLIVPLWN